MRQGAGGRRWPVTAWPWCLAFVLCGWVASTLAQTQRRSGFEDMGASTQAMQRDDTQNPAMLWVADGESLWQHRAGSSGRSCLDCHGPAPQSMRGVAARYPALDGASGQVLNLGQRIRQCRLERQQAPVFAYESRELLGLEAYVALQSRGLPLNPTAAAGLSSAATASRAAAATPMPAPDSARRLGEDLFNRRMGQLNLSCAQCHDQRAGQRLGASLISQGHATGYPIYRLEWQGLGSLQRRLRNCMSGVRAEPFAYGAPELVALELYLAVRAAGMPMESPAVRP